MRDWKSILPLLVALLIVGLAAGLAPMLAREISYQITLGRSQAVRSELAAMSGQYGHLAHIFRLAAEEVKPAVVEVHVVREAGPSAPRGFLERWRGSPPQDPVEEGLGSGVVIDADQGYILTNHHVVERASQVEVILANGRRLDAEWVRSDWKTDLAVVKVRPGHLFGARLGDSDSLAAGDMVLAIGAPDGLAQTVTFGIISAIGRTGVDRDDRYHDFIQTDAAINRGNSGGPLINLQGQVIGINTAIHTRSGGNEGIGFAIPSNMARHVAEQLINTGTVVRGFIGIRMQSVNDDLVRTFNLPRSTGVLIAEVAAGGPADRAGLAQGDFITAIHGREIRTLYDLRTVVSQLTPGQTVPFELVRKGQPQTIPVEIGRQPDDMNTAFVPAVGGILDRAGLQLLELTEPRRRAFRIDDEIRGILVGDVRRGSRAWDAGLRGGDVIVSVGGRPATSVELIVAALESSIGGVRLKVFTAARGERFLTLEP